MYLKVKLFLNSNKGTKIILHKHNKSRTHTSLRCNHRGRDSKKTLHREYRDSKESLYDEKN